MERSVRRSDLDSPRSTAPSSPESIALDRLEDFRQLEFVDNTVNDTLPSQYDAGEEELEFRLFATQPAQQVGGVQNVKIRSPTPEHREPSFLQPRRPGSYYFTDTTEDARLDISAVSDNDIHRMASIKWFGTAYPIKLLMLPAATQPKAIRSQTDTVWSRLLPKTVPSVSRKRPGKKSRIKIRMRRKAIETKKEELKAAQEAKDAEQREKRARKNREKKIKKRIRDKAKLAQDQSRAQAEVGAPDDAGMDDNSAD